MNTYSKLYILQYVCIVCIVVAPPVSSVTVEVLNSTALVLTWTLANRNLQYESCISYYTVMYGGNIIGIDTNVRKNTIILSNLGYNSHTTTISGLQEFATYSINLTLSNAVGTSVITNHEATTLSTGNYHIYNTFNCVGGIRFSRKYKYSSYSRTH